MEHKSIISGAEAQQILRNDLWKRALEKHAADLNNAGAQKRAEIMAEIEQQVDRELRQRARKSLTGFLLR